MPTKGPTLIDAIDLDAYQWLAHHAPVYLDAIEAELARGMTPEAIKALVLRNVGPERIGLALRCEQAARYVERMAA